MHIFLKISQQTFWQVLGKVITSFATFIVLALVSRNYGEAGTGIFTLALTYLAIFYLLSDFGFNAHVLRNLKSQTPLRGPDVKSEWRKLLGTRIIWSVVLVGLAVGLLPFWPFTSSEFAQAVTFGSLAILASGVFVTGNLVFQSKLRYDLSVLASSMGTIFGLVLFIYLVFLKYPLSSLLLAHLLSWMVVATVSVIILRRIFKAISPIFDKSYTISLFKQSWPIAATLALNVIYFRADAFMLAYFKGTSDVGIYNVAYTLFQTALVLPTFIMNSYYPLMLKSFRGMKFVAVGLLGLAGLGTVLTYSLSPLIIAILTGGGFRGSTESLQILSLGFPAYFLSALLMWVMVTKGKYQLMLIIYGLGLMVNLILNFIYIPQYSYLAASWITVISEYLILGMQIVSLRKV